MGGGEADSSKKLRIFLKRKSNPGCAGGSEPPRPGSNKEITRGMI